MQKTRLGKTDLMVSQISFGALPIQSVDRDSAVKVVRYAFEQGINFFDTARSYTTSEEDLGLALEGCSNDVIIATKSVYKNLEKLYRDFTISLENLKRSYIDLYQFHIVQNEKELEAILQKDGPLQYLKEQQLKGRLRHIGITSHRPALMLKALKTGAFETVQIPLNYIENEPLQELVPLARQLDIGIIAMKPVAGGVFSDNRSAIKWILQHPDVVPIPGMCQLAEVDDNLKALGSPLSSSELDQLEEDKEELGTVFCRRCDYCMPCPQGIEASYIVRSGMIFKRAGWDKLEQSHIDAFTKGLDCSQCGTCAARCPYELPLDDMVIDESKAMLLKAVELGKLTEEEMRDKLVAAEEKRNGDQQQ